MLKTALLAVLPLTAGSLGFVVDRQEALVARGSRIFADDQAAASKITFSSAAAKPAAKRSVQAIVEAALRQYLNEDDPVGADRGKLILDGLSHTEATAALDYLAERIYEAPLHYTMLPHLLELTCGGGNPDQWKETLRWVTEHADKHPEQIHWFRMPLASWAKQDAPAARDWVRARKELQKNANVFHGVVYANFLPDHLAALWQELPALPDHERIPAITRLTQDVGNPELRQDLFKSIAQQPTEFLRYRLCKKALQELAASDPAAAITWAGELPLMDPKMIYGIRGRLAAQVIEKYPVETTAMLLKGMPADLHAKILKQLQRP